MSPKVEVGVNFEEIVEMIRDFADEIESVNPDNIQELTEFLDIGLNAEDLSEAIGEQVSPFAVELIRKYNIPLYSAIRYVGIDETVIRLLKSKNIEEFVERLKDYREFMECWRDNEITVVEDVIDFEIPQKLTLCAVVYIYWYGCTSLAGHSFVAKVYYTDQETTVEEFERALDEEGIEYDEILTKEDLKGRLVDDYKYRAQLGEGCWGTPTTEFEYIVVL